MTVTNIKKKTKAFSKISQIFWHSKKKNPAWIHSILLPLRLEVHVLYNKFLGIYWCHDCNLVQNSIYKTKLKYRYRTELENIGFLGVHLLFPDTLTELFFLHLIIFRWQSCKRIKSCISIWGISTSCFRWHIIYFDIDNNLKYN